jgi:hypothetical protein
MLPLLTEEHVRPTIAMSSAQHAVQSSSTSNMQGRCHVVLVVVNNKLPLVQYQNLLGEVTSSFGDLEDGPAWAVVTWSLSLCGDS